MLRQGGKSTSFVSGNRKTIHTTFSDGGELVEEYDVKTDELLLRKQRARTKLGGEGKWEYLVGDAPVHFNPEVSTIVESSSNPIFTRKDTDRFFQWRIRNLPYPAENYDISIDHADGKVVIRTKNKKYYKRIEIPEMRRLEADLIEGALSWHHANNTLVVSYQKPAEILDLEAKDKVERKKMHQSATQQDGDVQCNQQ